MKKNCSKWKWMGAKLNRDYEVHRSRSYFVKNENFGKYSHYRMVFFFSYLPVMLCVIQRWFHFSQLLNAQKHSHLFVLEMCEKKKQALVGLRMSKCWKITNRVDKYFGCEVSLSIPISFFLCVCVWAQIDEIQWFTEVYHVFVDYLIGISTHLVRFQKYVWASSHMLPI